MNNVIPSLSTEINSTNDRFDGTVSTGLLSKIMSNTSNLTNLQTAYNSSSTQNQTDHETLR